MSDEVSIADREVICFTCRYWSDPFEDHAECRRNPPSSREQPKDVGPSPIAVWPFTNVLDWCGEHSWKAEK